MGRKKFSNQSGMSLFKTIFLIVIIVILVMVYKEIPKNSEEVFEKNIKRIGVLSEYAKKSHNTEKVNINFTMDPLQVDQYTTVDAQTSNFQFETDKKNEMYVMSMNWQNGSQTMTDVKAKTDSDLEKIYLRFGNLDRSVLIDWEDLYNENYSAPKLKDFSKAKEIVIKKIKEKLDEEYFSAEKVEKYSKKYQKNTFKITERQMKEEMLDIAQELRDDYEFLNCFENSIQVQEDIDDMLSSNYSSSTGDDTSYIRVSMYTTGIMKTAEIIEFEVFEDDKQVNYCEAVYNKNTVKFNWSDVENKFKLEMDENKGKITAQYIVNEGTFNLDATKNSQGIYDYNVTGRDEYDGRMTAKGTIKIDKGQVDITCTNATVNQDQYNLNMKLSVKMTYDEPIDDFDTSNIVSIKDLTENDLQIIGRNLFSTRYY